MALISRIIEKNENEEMEVFFQGTVETDSPDYTDEYDTIKGNTFHYVENIYWATEVFSHEENNIIENYLNEHFSSIADEIIQKNKEEYSFNEF